MAGVGDEKGGARALLPVMKASSRPGMERSTHWCNKLFRVAYLSTAILGTLIFIDGLLKSHILKNLGGLWNALGSVDALDYSSVYRYGDVAQLCPQANELLPSVHRELWDDIRATYSDSNFKENAINWLAGAVRIPTESYDEMEPVGVDPRWEVFGLLHEYLLEAFPLIYSTLKVTKVNTYGIIYEWEGSDLSLRPILLTAHQDVVPVEPRTVDQWTHPPYSGFFDGRRIWGRGSSDDKSGLIGILSSIETLIAADFQPTRKVVLAFGFDEEASAYYGARELGMYMEKTFGEDAFAILVDEGGGFLTQYGSVFAIPAIGEKGYLDVLVDVSSPGGHSSIPPAHTSIGMLSSLLVQIEMNPMNPKLDRSTPFYGTLQCVAAHATDMPGELRKFIKDSIDSDKALRTLEKVLSRDRSMRSFISTTQAIDLIEGGVKSNALPEQAWAVINHRIATQSSVDAVRSHDTRILEDIASRFNLSFNAFGEDVTKGSGAKYGSLVLSDAYNSALEPAPITPTGEDAAPFKLLSGTIKATYDAYRNFESHEAIKIAPGISTGNTDTQHYWKLTKHIFRYSHLNGDSDGSPLGCIHTVNESIDVDAFLEMITFFTTLILNADESTAL